MKLMRLLLMSGLMLIAGWQATFAIDAAYQRGLNQDEFKADDLNKFSERIARISKLSEWQNVIDEIRGYLAIKNRGFTVFKTERTAMTPAVLSDLAKLLSGYVRDRGSVEVSVGSKKMTFETFSGLLETFSANLQTSDIKENSFGKKFVVKDFNYLVDAYSPPVAAVPEHVPPVEHKAKAALKPQPLDVEALKEVQEEKPEMLTPRADVDLGSSEVIELAQVAKPKKELTQAERDAKAKAYQDAKKAKDKADFDRRKARKELEKQQKEAAKQAAEIMRRERIAQQQAAEAARAAAQAQAAAQEQEARDVERKAKEAKKDLLRDQKHDRARMESAELARREAVDKEQERLFGKKTRTFYTNIARTQSNELHQERAALEARLALVNAQKQQVDAQKLGMENEAATDIQRVARGYKARRQAAEKRKEFAELSKQQERDYAARVIQRAQRKHRKHSLPAQPSENPLENLQGSLKNLQHNLRQMQDDLTTLRAKVNG